MQLLAPPVCQILSLRQDLREPGLANASCCPDKSETGCKYGDKCRFRHVEADGQPSKKSKNSGVNGSVAFKESIQLGCVSQDSYPRKSILRKRKCGIKTRPQILQGHVAPNKISGKKGSIARRHSTVWTSRAQSVRPQNCQEDTRRNRAPRKIRSHSGMRLNEKCLQAQITDKATV